MRGSDKSFSKREIEKSILWLLTHRQSDVKTVLRNFKKLAPQKQVTLDKKLLYLVSILDLAVNALKNGKRGTRCASCGMPMHVKWIGCENPVPLITSKFSSEKNRYDEEEEKMKSLTLIVAMTPAGVIAVDGQIPWHVSEDMKRFKRLTTGHAIIMGRKTYESIGKPLPNRRSIVITRDKSWQWQHDLQPPSELGGVPKSDGQARAETSLFCVHSIEDALNLAYDHDASPFVIGGGEIYTLAFPYVTKLEITYVARKEEHALAVGGNAVFFPGLYPNPWHWRCVQSEPATEFPNVEFMTFERRPSE